MLMVLKREIYTACFVAEFDLFTCELHLYRWTEISGMANIAGLLRNCKKPHETGDKNEDIAYILYSI